MWVRIPPGAPIFVAIGANFGIACAASFERTKPEQQRTIWSEIQAIMSCTVPPSGPLCVFYVFAAHDELLDAPAGGGRTFVRRGELGHAVFRSAHVDTRGAPPVPALSSGRGARRLPPESHGH